jgi:hypothetical protein
MPFQNPSTSSNQRGPPTIVKCRKQTRNVTQPSPSGSELNLTDFSCNICFEILVEPIKLVCNHELCLVCFRSMIVNKNFKCPMCRLSIPCVYRKKRESNLRLFVDDTRWNAIKQAFPDEVEKRIEDEKRKKEQETKNTRLIRKILRVSSFFFKFRLRIIVIVRYLRRFQGQKSQGSKISWGQKSQIFFLGFLTLEIFDPI